MSVNKVFYCSKSIKRVKTKANPSLLSQGLSITAFCAPPTELAQVALLTNSSPVIQPFPNDALSTSKRKY